MEAPSGAKTRHDWTAVEHLELWKIYRDHWCDHNPSVTISVKEHEWAEVEQWTADHWNSVVGITFLPDTDHVYQQAPYEEVSDEEWESLRSEHPSRIDFSVLDYYERSDQTTSTRELACVAGVCEI